MISIIIASADNALLKLVKVNINETIGVPYEILAFDNRNGAKSICEIYNTGLRQARYPILCLMHEDISFLTKNWGEAVKQVFDRHPEIGLIGIAGSTFKSMMPIGWFSEGSPQSERSNLIQAYKYIQRDTAHIYKNPADEVISRVAVVDGVWMCVRKEVTEKYRFDSLTFKGFHCYDVDFCLSAGKDFGIAVVYNVLLRHLSEGSWDRTWIKESLLLFKKWVTELPRSTEPISIKRLRKIERHNFRFWLQQIHSLGFKHRLAFQVLHNPHLFRVLGLKYFLKLHYSILNEYYLKNRSKKLRHDTGHGFSK